jgi:outer membrane protein OmpA-like peptidoglycan-associated protein
MLELQAKPQLRIGYAYDYNTSKLVNYNRGTHELMLRYDLKKKDREEIDQNTPFSYLYGKPVAAPPPPPPAAPPAKDSDGDGVSDEFDSCPDAAGLKELSGCPDKDGDRVADKYDECPDVAGSQFMNGCPDKDGDGVADYKDACPDKKGSRDFNGCPDSDGDGISDDKDQCPQIKGYSYNQGCPPSDKDNDGIPDDRDKCPEIAGKSANKGCPGWDDLNFNPKNVTFVTGSSQLTALAVKELDILTEIMRRNPAMSVDIIGHTDNVGSPAFNLKLSQNRAAAVKAYLVSKGTADTRLTSSGMGQAQPVAENSTVAGRALNRRVDFNLKN